MEFLCFSILELGEPNPREWPGEEGREFDVPEDKQTYDKYFKIHEFNILASDRIALNRTLMDSRTTTFVDLIINVFKVIIIEPKFDF